MQKKYKEATENMLKILDIDFVLFLFEDMKGGFEEAVKKVKRQTLLARAGYKFIYDLRGLVLSEENVRRLSREIMRDLGSDWIKWRTECTRLIPVCTADSLNKDFKEAEVDVQIQHNDKNRFDNFDEALRRELRKGRLCGQGILTWQNCFCN
jgi:hypothetical protein